jgi:hypothetical protein
LTAEGAAKPGFLVVQWSRKTPPAGGVFSRHQKLKASELSGGRHESRCRYGSRRLSWHGCSVEMGVHHHRTRHWAGLRHNRRRRMELCHRHSSLHRRTGLSRHRSLETTGERERARRRVPGGHRSRRHSWGMAVRRSHGRIHHRGCLHSWAPDAVLQHAGSNNFHDCLQAKTRHAGLPGLSVAARSMDLARRSAARLRGERERFRAAERAVPGCVASRTARRLARGPPDAVAARCSAKLARES